ncbi:Glutaredoxin-related protein [Acinetobacter phage MD-2021a]|nr:Glutaredoxin-related protein [Acinetobacter phage MD-2021a]CAH1088943.1 Glutaredoxin-related protein [Acinetobacter phage MD-2021a]
MFKIYGRNGCSSCVQAKALLESKGIPLEYLSIGKDYDLQKFMSFNPSHKTFPLITRVVEGVEKYVGGLTELKEILK